MRIVHYSEYQGETSKVADVVLVERETGGLAVLTDKHIAFYDKDLQFERTVRFKHRYAEFGVIQGPDGKLWFAGYEYWSWMFGIVHRMNFEIHAMPLGNAQPTHTWICKACERLSVLRLSNPSLDILYTVSPGASDRPSSWMFFDVQTGESHSVDEFDDIQSKVGAHRIKNEPLSLRFEQSSNDFRYASEEWWMYAFSSCSDVRRKLAGRLEQQLRRCVWHPEKSIVDAQYTLQIDDSYKRLVLKNEEEILDSWDLKELVEVKGFSRVTGWYRYPDASCEGTLFEVIYINGKRVSEMEVDPQQRCTKTLAILTGTFSPCYQGMCEMVTGLFELEDGGKARLIELIQAPSSSSVRLADGRIVLSVGKKIVSM